MTISSTQSYVEYNADGSTTAFTIPFYFLLNSDISVMVSDASGNVTELTNGSDFSVTGQGVSSGGTCTLNTAYPAGYEILIYRDPPVTQETAYYENGKFPAKSHEAALDKLTMLIQENNWRFDSLALSRSTIFAGYFDAIGLRISNLEAPVDSKDAANKDYVDSQVSDFKDYVDTAVSAEAEARKNGDDTLSDRIDAEALAREAADTSLQNNINSEALAREAGDNAEATARQEAIASLQDQLTGNVPLEASAFSVISWHAQEVSNSVTIPDNVNAWSFGPTLTIAAGQSVDVGDDSFWTIANGLQYVQNGDTTDYGELTV